MNKSEKEYMITKSEQEKTMPTKDFRKLVKTYGGWIEGNQAYFPSVHQKDQFLKAFNKN